MSSKALYFLSGLLIGGVVGGACVGKYLNDKFSTQLKDMEEYYKNLSDKDDSPDDTHSDGEEHEVIKNVNDAIEKIKTGEVDQENELRKSYVYNSDRIRYDRITESNPEKSPGGDSEKLSEQEHPEDDDPTEKKKPYLISSEEYNDPLPYHEKVTLFYDISYDALGVAEDGELIESDTEEPVEDPFTDKNIGSDVIDTLDKGENGAYVYIRNDETSTDYEVIVRRYE